MKKLIDRYFDHEADIGIIGRGETLCAAFVDAAEALFAIMANLNEIQPKKTIYISFEESDPELAFVTWLNCLIADAKIKGLILCKFSVTKQDSHWQGQASGEPWRKELEHGTEVKGATLTMLSVRQKNHQWEARCVVDV